MTKEKKPRKPAKPKKPMLPDNVIKFPNAHRRRMPSTVPTMTPDDDDAEEEMNAEQHADMLNMAQAEQEVYQILQRRQINPKYAAHMMVSMAVKILHFNADVDLVDLICTGVNTEMMLHVMQATGEPEPEPSGA